jgi:hypothetical protein
MIGMVVSTSRALHAEHTAFLRAEKRQVRAQLAAHVGAHVEARVQASVARHVDERLGREPGGSRPPQPPRTGVRRRRTD